MNPQRDGREQIRGVVQQVKKYPGSRADLVVLAEDGRVLRGRMPAGLRDKSMALVGRRVAFWASVDDHGRYSYPRSGELLTEFMRLSITSVREARLTRYGARPVMVVDLLTAEAGDAVLVIPVEVARVLHAGLAEPVTLPSPNGRAR